MTSIACKLLCLVLSLAFVTQSIGSFVTQSTRYGDCQLSDPSIKQSKTGKLVQNKPEWEVRVFNPCYRCNFINVRLSCPGFKSVTPVGRELVPFRDVCLLRPGIYIYPHIDVAFTYVWDKSFEFKVLNGDIICS